MQPARYVYLAAVFCPFLCGQTTIDVGSGAPTPFITQLFQTAYFRNGFANSVALPPLGNVKKVGTNGLVQEFSDAKNTPGLKLALVMPNATAIVVEGKTYIFQFQSSLYTYWTQVGPTTAGMPVMDTANCPQLVAINTCQYQLFDKPYALFAYASLGTLTATNFFIRDPYYTKWTGYGGIGTMGPPNTAETAVVSVTTATATAQTYDRGAIYSFTTGVNTGRQIGVKPPIWDVYNTKGAHVGQLGFPVSEELITANGHRRQGFENGAVEYDPVTQVVIFLPAVATVSVVAPSPIRLKAGDSVNLQVNLSDAQGSKLTGREVLWTTSNGRVATVDASGLSATVKGIGGGTATIRASSEGKQSAALTVVVTAQCCAIGEGAPTTAITQSFLDAATRNHLNLTLPSSSAVIRSGAGFTQPFNAADGSGPVWIVVPDKLATGVVIAGRFLSAWVSMAGATGQLGFPVADVTAGGRQLFENGALAGDPVQLVVGDVLAKWGSLGYEAGAAGLPQSGPQPYLTFRGSPGQAQAFRGGVFYQVAAGKVYFVGGLILARYASSGGAAGRIGAPINDEYALNGRRRQDFEGGFIDYASGDTIAQLTESARRPVVTATPGSVIAGSSLRLAVGGFESNASVRVSITGAADFVVTVPTGAYVWESFVPAAAKGGSVSVRAVNAADSTKSAQTTYTIRASSDIRPTLATVAGDNQSSAPGAMLPLPLRISVKDELGNALPRVPVQFAASTGARIESASTITDSNGEAIAMLRVPLSEGIILATARAASQVVTFSARAVRFSLSGFPQLSQAVDGTLGSTGVAIAKKGAMLTSAAAILRYHQVRGDLPTAGGLTDPVLLNEAIMDSYLGSPADPVVNLWDMGSLVGNAVDPSVEKTDLSVIRDLLSTGSPIMLALSLSNGSSQNGAHFVVATGVGPTGDILLMDPNPAFARNSLADYTNGFATPFGTFAGVLTGAVRLVPRTPKAGGFLVAVTSPLDIASPLGPCGSTLEFPAVIAVAGTPAQAATTMRLRACDGGASLYQLDLSAQDYSGVFEDLVSATRTDLSGSGPSSLNALQQNGVWSVTPTAASVSAVVNAADFSPRLAPGGIATIFGGGFGASGASGASVDVNGRPASVLGAFPFQLNVQIPPLTSPGASTLTVHSNLGTVSQPIQVQTVAPAIFQLGSGQAAAINRDGSLNTSSNPALRGEALVAFGTGFGSVSPKGNLMVADSTVVASLGGTDLPVQFAGLTPGFVGLYQVNVNIPLGIPPGLRLNFSVKQGNITSNPVEVAIQ